VVVGVERVDVYAELKANAKFLQPSMSDRESVVAEMAIQIILGEQSPVIGRISIGREDSNVARPPRCPDGVSCGVTRCSSSNYHNWIGIVSTRH